MKTSCLALAAAILAGAPAFAHHAAVMFDFSEQNRKKIQGVVKEFQWTNPHSWIVLVVKNGSGQTEEWNFEGMSPSYLSRHGWTKRTLAPGAEIGMNFAPMKDGRKGGFTINVIMPDGSVLQELPVPGDAPPPQNNQR